MANDGQVIIDVDLNTSKVIKETEQASKKIGDSLDKNVSKAVNNVEKNVGKISAAFNKIKTGDLDKQFKKVDTAINKTSSSIEKQKQKLEDLKKAYDSASNPKSQNKIEQQMKNTELSIARAEKQLDKLSNKKININSLIDSRNGLDGNFSSASMSITKNLDEVKKKAEDTGKAVKKSLEDSIKSLSVGESVSKIGKTFNDVGNTLTTRVTAPATLLAVAAGKIGMDFDSSMSRVKAISGATGEEFTKLHDQALQLGKDTAFSAKEAAVGMENLSAAGFTTSETMAAMPGLLNLAAASGESLATSSDIAASTLRGFGLEANQAGHVADVLAKNANATNAAVADTGEAMKYIAPVAHSMGLSLEEVTAAIGELANSGIQGSQAGTTLRSALTRLASPSKEAAGAMKSIGFNAFDSQGKLKGFSTIIEEYNKALANKTDQQKQDLTATIFGQEAMSGMLVLMDGGKKGLDDLTDSYKNADGAAEDMAKTMQDNAGSSIEQMMGSIETAAIKLEEVAAPTIRKIADEIQDLANDFADLSPEAQEFIIKAVLLAAALGPVAKTLGAVELVGGKFIGIAGNIASKFGLIGTAAAGVAETGAAAEAGTAALGGLTVAGGLAAGAVAALAVGVAAYATHQALMNKSMDTSTEDLNAWERAVNSVTGGTIKSKSELQKLGLVYKDFGEGVSDSFKEGVQKARDEYRNLEVLINQSNIGDKITEANQGKISASINNIIDEAKKTVLSRKDELNKDFVAGMTANGSGIDENEQKVLDIMSRSSDDKLAKIDEIQSKITKTFNDAIKDHGKLSSLDVEVIQNYAKQIERIKIEATAKNKAESTFTENNFVEQLNGISAEDAKKVYGDTSKTIHDDYAKLKATYKTETDDLALQLKNSQKDLDNAQSKEQEDKAKADIAAIQQEINDKNNLYDKAAEEERGKRRKLLDMLYEKNPTLKNNFNEVTGEMFTNADKDAQGRKEKLRSEFSELANVTETGMQHIQDANGKWHDIYVTFDEATGNITGTYDTFTGKYGGYSAKFENGIKTTGAKIKAEMEELQKSLMFNGGGVKLDSDNNAINATTDQLITKLDTVIKKADGTKTAIQDVNGTKVKLEFDKDGTLTNAQDVEDAINGKFENNPAVVKTKIEVDGKQISTVDNTIKKLKDLPQDKNVKISINGEEAIMTAGEAEKKLSEIPPDTNTDIKVSTSDADTKIPEIKGQIDKLDGKEVTTKITIDGKEETNIDTIYEKLKELPPDTKTDIVINGEQITTVGEAKAKLDEIPKDTNTEIKVDSDSADSKLDTTKDKIDNVPSTKEVNIVVNYLTGSTEGATLPGIGGAALSIGQSNYTGTNYLRTGLSTVHEHGWETANNNNVKMLNSGLAFLVGHHYTGGDGINDHMTSVNEMQNDITKAVDSRFSNIVNTLTNSLSKQSSLLTQIGKNTGDTATTNKESVKLNQKIATDFMSNLKSGTTGSFTSLKNELDMANSSKEKADNLKVGNFDYYSNAKRDLDEINGQLDELKNKQQEISDSQSVDAGKGEKKWNEAAKKEIEAQQHVLEKKKDLAEQEVNVAKEAAENEIQAAKNVAEQQIKIAEAKKEKLTKLSEAVTTALKNGITAEKNAAVNSINDELKDIESTYNKNVKKIEDDVKKQSDKLDSKIKALEKKTEENSRSKERDEANGNIFRLTTTMNNTASYADKRSLQLQIDEAQKGLQEKEDTWNIEDQKSQLEEEKTLLSERAENRKKSLEEQYNREKEGKEKELKNTNEYYDKLLEEDNINAQARYMLLQGNQNDLVQLLQSYNPLWQDAGQSLADSLLNGLNSQKQSMQDAVNELASIRLGQQAPPPNAKRMNGYASGTSYNRNAGYYLTNEDGWETSDRGDVAYVSKGTAIKNKMQSIADMKAEISKQLASNLPYITSQLNATMQAEQAQTRRMISSVVNNNTSTKQDIKYDGSNKFHIENLVLQNHDDVEQFFNEAESIRLKNKPC